MLVGPRLDELPADEEAHPRLRRESERERERSITLHTDGKLGMDEPRAGAYRRRGAVGEPRGGGGGERRGHGRPAEAGACVGRRGREGSEESPRRREEEEEEAAATYLSGGGRRGASVAGGEWSAASLLRLFGGWLDWGVEWWSRMGGRGGVADLCRDVSYLYPPCAGAGGTHR